MINQLEVPMYLEEALPEISEELKHDKIDNPYKTMNMLIAFLCKNIKEHNYPAIKRCFKVADKLYNKGNDAVKNAVQNVFVFSFTNVFQSYPAEKKQLLALLPVTLYSLYITQLYN